MFQLLVLLLLTLVSAAPIDPRAYAFVTLTKAPTYVTVGAENANQFITDNANAVTYYSTQWPVAETPAPAPPAPAPPAPATTQDPAPPAPTTSDYQTVLVSTETPAPSPNTDIQLETSANQKFPDAVPTTTAPAPAPVTTSPPPPSNETPVTTEQPAPAPTTTAAAAATTSAPAGNQNPAAPVPEPTTSTTTTTSTVVTTTSVPASTPVASPNALQLAPPQYIVYSPYLNGGGCKDYNTVYGDLSMLKSKGITRLRTYGTDCNNMDTILPAAASLGITVSQGVWIGPDGFGPAVDESIADIMAYGQKNGWGIFDNIVFGNEDIVNGFITIDELLDKAGSFKAQLRAAGFNAPFLHAEVTNIIQANPQLCGDLFDIVALNAHSYFDPYSTADQSGPFVKGQIGLVAAVCGSKQIWISETGYPSQGKTNGGQVPTKENQAIAIQSIYDHVGADVVILTTFDDMWKSPGPYGVEQYFGVADLLV